jgi:hypothetical protein
MDREEMKRVEAQVHTDAHFKRSEIKTTYTSRCYEEWYEVWDSVNGKPVTEEDLDAFRFQPRGQGHRVTKVSETQIRLDCACDSGD